MLLSRLRLHRELLVRIRTDYLYDYRIFLDLTNLVNPKDQRKPVSIVIAIDAGVYSSGSLVAHVEIIDHSLIDLQNDDLTGNRFCPSTRGLHLC